MERRATETVNESKAVSLRQSNDSPDTEHAGAIRHWEATPAVQRLRYLLVPTKVFFASLENFMQQMHEALL
jgi:hypothetical protein